MNLPLEPESIDWASDTGRRVDAVCNRFEAAWRSGGSALLETFLDGWQEPERTVLLHELIELEVHHRSQHGLDCSVDEFLRRFPDADAARLATLFESYSPTSSATPQQGAKKVSGPFSPTEANALVGEKGPDTFLAPIGDYELLEEIARGGMGVVYRARQIKLNRIVALKLILAGQHASPAEVRRFQAEAENAAGLDHPHIVPIYEVGQHQGQHYYTVKLIDGPSLGRSLPQLADDPRAGARLLVQVARAVHHAHQAGVLHRDLKPANILVDRHGEPHVADFGLAKRLRADRPQTVSGAVIGTPAYMAPEQAEGRTKRVTTAADVYALGAILYECLTGAPPFRGDTPLETLKQVVSQEPVPPLSRNRKVPRDLETICLKCLHKDPRGRYASAEALAEDLERFLAGTPIQARPAGHVERLWRWCRRNRTVAVLAATVQLALVGLLVLGAWSYTQIQEALKGAETQQQAAMRARDTAVAEAYRAKFNETRALRLAHVPGWRSQALENLRSLVHFETPQRDVAELRSEAIACLGELDAQEEMQLTEHTQSVWSLDFSPDGAVLATAGYDGFLCLWNVHEGRLLRKFQDPHVNLSLRHTESGPLPAVRFHPDGSGLAFATWTAGVGLLPLRAAHKTGDRLPFPHPARYLAFDARGRELAVSGGNGQVSLYDAATLHLKRQMNTGLQGPLHLPVALSPRGDLLATVGPAYEVQLHNIAKGGQPISLGHHRDIVRSLCFSPNGNMLASAAEDSAVKLWNTERPSDEPITLRGHGARANCVAFSPDGSLLASAGDDSTVRLWDTRTGQAILIMQTNLGPVLAVAFSPDGSRLAAGTGNGNQNCPVLVYKLTDRQVRRRLSLHYDDVRTFAFHPTKPILASGSFDTTVILWDLQTDRPQERWQVANNNPPYVIAFTSDGTLLAVGPGGFFNKPVSDYAVEVRETKTGIPRRLLRGPRSNVESLTFDPPAKRLAVGTADGSGFIFDILSGKPIQQLKCSSSIVAVAFLDHGKRLLVQESAGRLAIRDSTLGRTVLETTVPGIPRCVAVRGDERCVAVGCEDGMVRIVRLEGMECKALAKMHEEAILAIAYSSNGQFLASGGGDGRVVLWDALGLQRLATLPQASPIRHLDFDRSGACLAWTSGNKITVWNIAQVRPELAAIGLDGDTDPRQAAAPSKTQHLPIKKTPKEEGISIPFEAQPVTAARGPAAQAIWDLYRNPFDVDAHQRLGTLLIETGQMESGRAHLHMALALQPDLPGLRSPRVLKALRRSGEAYVSQDRWQEAAGDFIPLARLAPQDALASMQAAALLLITENRVAYRRLCDQMLAQFRNTSSPYDADRTVKACLMGEEVLDAHGALAKLACLALEVGQIKAPGNLRYFHFARGLSEYRQGHYADALTWFERNRVPAHWLLGALERFFEAMALHQLGRTAEAARLLESVPELSTIRTIPPSSDWHDWLFCQIALKEARTVLQTRSH